nr:MAG TPA: hypothetical protein [Caudoviricetes sp.]
MHGKMKNVWYIYIKGFRNARPQARALASGLCEIQMESPIFTTFSGEEAGRWRMSGSFR